MVATELESVTDLLRRAGDGEQAAWNALVARYENLLWSIARGYRLDTADAGDVVQTCWLKLLENLSRIEQPERLAGWLATTARNECLRLLRKAGKVIPDDGVLDLVDDKAPPLDTALLEQERDALLWQCFGQLPERCQRLLRVLMAVDRPVYAEVSEALGLPIGTIGPTRMRCLSKLRVLTGAAGLTVERTSS